MLSKKFYYGTVRKVIIAFGSLFNDIEFDRVDSSGVYQTVQVPLSYTPKEKFIRRIHEVSQPNTDEVWIKETLPRMGFELNAISYAPERKVNTMERIQTTSGANKFMYNRVPYDMNFTLYIGTRKFDDSLRIVEQIIPFFTPEFTVKILDKEDFGITTNIPFVLDSTDFVVDDDAAMDDERRSIVWTLGFTAKAYFYAATTDETRIKKSIVDISQQDGPGFFEGYMAEVDPKSANEDEPHTIQETISEVHRDTHVQLARAGGYAVLDSLD